MTAGETGLCIIREHILPGWSAPDTLRAEGGTHTLVNHLWTRMKGLTQILLGQL